MCVSNVLDVSCFSPHTTNAVSAFLFIQWAFSTVMTSHYRWMLSQINIYNTVWLIISSPFPYAQFFYKFHLASLPLPWKLLHIPSSVILTFEAEIIKDPLALYLGIAVIIAGNCSVEQFEDPVIEEFLFPSQVLGISMPYSATCFVSFVF